MWEITIITSHYRNNRIVVILNRIIINNLRCCGWIIKNIHLRCFIKQLLMHLIHFTRSCITQIFPIQLFCFFFRKSIYYINIREYVCFSHLLLIYMELCPLKVPTNIIWVVSSFCIHENSKTFLYLDRVFTQSETRTYSTIFQNARSIRSSLQKRRT